MERLVADAQCRGVFARVVPGMGFASHGPEVAPLGAALARALEGLAPSAPRIPFLSGFTGAAPAGALDAGYWADNLTRPFRFATGVRALVERRASHVVELSGQIGRAHV